MGFRAGPFVLCKDGCCHQRRRNTNFGPENFFSRKNFPPHMCSHNDQRDVGIILSHVCWGRTPPPPGTAGRAAPAQKNPRPSTATKEGEGGLGKWASVPPPPPPPAKQFSSRPVCAGLTMWCMVLVSLRGDGPLFQLLPVASFMMVMTELKIMLVPAPPPAPVMGTTEREACRCRHWRDAKGQKQHW